MLSREDLDHDHDLGQLAFFPSKLGVFQSQVQHRAPNDRNILQTLQNLNTKFIPSSKEPGAGEGGQRRGDGEGLVPGPRQAQAQAAADQAARAEASESCFATFYMARGKKNAFY